MEPSTKYLSYKILPELKLIIQYLSGPVEGEDAIALVKKIRKDTGYDPVFNVLIDFRDITITWNTNSSNSLTHFVSFMKESPDYMSGKKIVLLFSKPAQAVLSILLQKNYEAFPVTTDLYTTLEAATENLGLFQDSVYRIRKEIEKIKNRT